MKPGIERAPNQIGFVLGVRRCCAYSETMKPTVTFLAMLLLGCGVGYLIAPAYFQWLASAFEVPLVHVNPGASFAAIFHFALGCGALFAAAPIASTFLARLARWVPWTLGYLIFGCVVSSAVAVYYFAVYTWTLAGSQPFPPTTTMVSISALPGFRIPFIGMLTMVFVGRLHRHIPRPRATPDPQTRDA